jgi:hypothetical protein
MNSDIPLNVILNSYKIFCMSRFYTTFFSNKDLTLDINTSIKSYYLQYISPTEFLRDIFIGEYSVVAPLPSSTIYTYENMRNFIPLYN